ncbi:MAG: CoA pyrophosphatase [Ignavibacteria bacterium]|nr:CoA pyrophosphatase [Ignavibacteria bacterium]
MDTRCGEEHDAPCLTRERIEAAVRGAAARPVERDGFRHSAVLVPFVCIGGEWHLLFTKRTEDLEHHKGQVSFPGGASETGETPEQTALREAEEEVELAPALVTVLGEIDQMWTPSGYIITPVVGIVARIDDLRPSPSEVARVFTVPVSFFADEGNAVVKTVHVNGYVRDVYFYTWDGDTIWGATAFIIRAMLERLRRAG